MSKILSDISISRHAKWLRRVCGVAVSMAILDAQGQCLVVDEDDSIPISTILASKTGSIDWPCAGRGMQCHAEDGLDHLFYLPLYCRNDKNIGYLVTLLADLPRDGLDAFAEAFEDAVAALIDEYTMISELNAMAGELSERYEELHLVYAADQQLRGMKEGEDIFTGLLESCASHMNVDVAAFVQPDANLCVSATNLSKPIHNLDLVLVETRGDLFRFVNASRQAVVLNSMQDPRRSYIFTDMPLKILCCPIFQDKMVVAVLVLVNDLDKPDFSNSDRRLGEILANQLSSLSRLYTLLSESGTFNKQMAAALIESVEAKDPYTRGHSERVHDIAMDIGGAMALSAAEMENLHWGALLHDVGKIGIPDAILCKPSRLTEDEYTFIMVHPERSYEILRHIDRLKGAVPGARHHQEKYDGTGYPHGLRGADIPLNARIIAVADTYDSITSSRAYRAGRTHELAMREIDRVAGVQLDPEIVRVFHDICATEPEWMKRFNIRREEPQSLVANVTS